MARPALAQLRRALALLLVAAAPVLAQEAPAAIDEPLTAVPGDVARGLAIVRDATNATCLICHEMPIPEEPNHGTLGPPLHGVGDRYTAGELRLRIVDAKRVNPESIMPAYYRKEGLYRVDAPYANRTIYTAQEVEDVVAYLMTLRGR